MKIGRNDPCPCGSEEKYKRCCLPKHREFEHLEGERIRALYAAVDYLQEHYDEEVQAAFLTDFLDTLEDEEVARFEHLPDYLREAWVNNAYDWLIAEGEIEVDDGETAAVLPILANELDLTDTQSDWLQRMSQSPLALYRIEEILPGAGFRARRVSDSKEPLFEVDQQTSLDSFKEGDLLALRLVSTDPESDKYWLTSAVYAFDGEEEKVILEELRAVGDPEDEDIAWIVGNALMDLWIQALATEVEE